MSNSKLTKFKDKKGNTYPYLYIDEKSGIFYLRKRHKKNIVVISLETTEFTKARTSVFDRLSEVASRESGVSKKKELLFKDYYQIMIDEKKSIDTKESTLKRIDAVWTYSLEPYWSFLTCADINQDRVTDFITWHRRHRPGIQFINVFKYLGNVFNLMVERGDLPVNKKPKLIIPKDEQKKHDKQKGRYITDQEIKSILEHTDKVTWLAVMIAYCTGMRKMEICSILKSKIELHKDHYIFKLETDDTKTGMARQVPMPKILSEKIASQLDTNSDYLFPMKSDPKRHMSGQLLDKGWTEAKAMAQIKGSMRFHDLRHTAASNLAKDNINPVVSVTMLGMSLVTYQKAYLKLKSDDIIIASESNAARLGF